MDKSNVTHVVEQKPKEPATPPKKNQDDDEELSVVGKKAEMSPVPKDHAPEDTEPKEETLAAHGNPDAPAEKPEEEKADAEAVAEDSLKENVVLSQKRKSGGGESFLYKLDDGGKGKSKHFNDLKAHVEHWKPTIMAIDGVRSVWPKRSKGEYIICIKVKKDVESFDTSSAPFLTKDDEYKGSATTLAAYTVKNDDGETMMCGENPLRVTVERPRKVRIEAMDINTNKIGSMKNGMSNRRSQTPSPPTLEASPEPAKVAPVEASEEEKPAEPTEAPEEPAKEDPVVQEVTDVEE